MHLKSSTSAGKQYMKITKNITKMLRTVTIFGSTLPLRGLVNVIFGTVLMVSLSGMSSDRDAKRTNHLSHCSPPENVSISKALQFTFKLEM